MSRNITSKGTIAPSRQDVPTPRALIEAIENRFANIIFDLAATHANKVADRCFTPQDDSLSIRCDWGKAGFYAYQRLGRTFLNPPFANCRPWVAKAAQTTVIHPKYGPLVLLPAAVYSDWFNQNVRNFAHVYELFPRPFTEIRDCILADYSDSPGRSLWEWKK